MLFRNGEKAGLAGALPFVVLMGRGGTCGAYRCSRKQGGSGALRRPGSSRLRAGALGYGQAVRCSLNGQAMLAYEPDLRFLCRNRTGSAHRAGWFRGSYICCLRQRPMSESEHNPSTQPAAAGGHNLQPRRGWPPSPLNPLNLLNPLNPGPHSGPFLMLFRCEAVGIVVI